jgi:hypothetical protein
MYIQHKERIKHGLAWTDSILIREKRKHLSKTSDRVSKRFGTQAFKMRIKEKYS